MDLGKLLDFGSILVWLVGAGGCFFVGLVIWLISLLIGGRKDAKHQVDSEALRMRGVTAPAIIVSARKGMERNLYEKQELRIDYVVDVQPEGKPVFRQSFQHWSERRGFTVVFGQLAGEAGRKIWVTYDPGDPSQMIFEYYDEERQKIVERRELESRQ